MSSRLDERQISRAVAAFLFIAAFFPVALTLPGYGITWDEPGYVQQARRIGGWFTILASEPAAAFKDSVISEHWPVWEGGQPKKPGNESIQDRLNPPLAIALGGISATVLEGILNTYTAHRLIGALSYGAIVMLLYLWVGRAAGNVAGLVAALSFAFMPRVFGHAHIFATDLPATAWMFLATYSLAAHPDSRRWKWAGGVFLGLAAATKFTALVLPVPLFLWGAIRKDRRTMIYTAVGALVALLVMVIVNPALWHNTIDRIAFFIILSMKRSHIIAIPTYYFGKVYWFDLPWHHPWVMVFGTIPIITVLFAWVGIARVGLRLEKSPDAMLHVIVFLTLMATFMAPGAPGHDGERLFMPIFPFLAAMAGFGYRWIADKNRKILGAASFAMIAIPGLAGIICWHPCELSYYGLALGGARGAHRLGLETTYWMDALTPANEAALRNITQGTPRTFAPYFEQPLSWRAQAGRLGEGAAITGDHPHWVLLIGRQGMMDDFTSLAFELGAPNWELRKNGLRLVALFDARRMYDGIGARLNELRPNDWRAWYLKGLLAEATEDFSAAEDDYVKAMKFDPRHYRTLLHLGRVLRAQGQYPKALDFFYALTKKGSGAEVYMELARTYKAMGDNGNAIQAYRRVLEIHLNYPNALEEMMNIGSGPQAL